jgi:hypothetical protein
MMLAKSLLLGTAATIVATAGAFAADLPSKKAAPVTYVKICDAYGAGFFYIPGTETCIKVGGRVRADYAMSGKQDIYSTASVSTTTAGITNATGPTINAATGVTSNVVSTAAGVQNLYGWEARGRVDLDARTSTAYGTVQSVVALRLSRVNGVLDNSGPNGAVTSNSGLSTSPTLEAAYIRFAGFTFGAAKDNFSFMPSTFYGAGHWASFANGAKQIAYTAILGGGFSATLAVQDMQDTTAGGTAINAFTASSYNGMPQINGRVDYDQSWGSASLMGAVASDKAVISSAAGTQASKTAYALGGGLKVNLPMIAAGDVLWLNAAYASGMTEYTVNWTGAKSSDTKRNVAGYVAPAPSFVYSTAGGVELVKSWDVAAIFTHYWAPQWRHSFLASYGKVNGTTTSKATTLAAGGFGDMSVWNVGTQLAWLPTKDFEIGVDVLYARVSQDIRRSVTNFDTAVGSTANIYCATAGAASCVTKESKGNWTGRLRVERTF